MKADNKDVLTNMLSSDNLRCIHRVYTAFINNSMIELELDRWAITEEASW